MQLLNTAAYVDWRVLGSVTSRARARHPIRVASPSSRHCCVYNDRIQTSFDVVVASGSHPRAHFHYLYYNNRTVCLRSEARLWPEPDLAGGGGAGAQLTWGH